MEVDLNHYFEGGPDSKQGKIIIFTRRHWISFLGKMIIFVAWISYYYDLYLVNDDNIIDVTQNGIFDRKIAQLSLLRVQDVSSNVKGILPTIFNYGDVLVETAGEKENFVLEAVPDPQAFAAKVMELHDRLIASQNRGGQVVEGEGTILPKVCAPNNASPVISQPNNSPESDNEGEINKDDLNQGGEVKL